MAEYEVTIRPVEPGDALGLSRVQIDTWRDAYVGVLPDDTLLDLDEMRAAVRWTRIVGTLKAPEVVAVADYECSIVGFCHGGLGRKTISDVIDRDGSVAEVYAMYVDPSFQGLGLGRALLADVARRLISHGFESLVLTTLAEHRSGAAGQNHRLGTELGDPRRVDGAREDLAVDAVLTHPAGDELGELAAEIQDEDAVGHGAAPGGSEKRGTLPEGRPSGKRQGTPERPGPVNPAEARTQGQHQCRHSGRARPRDRSGIHAVTGVRSCRWIPDPRRCCGPVRNDGNKERVSRSGASSELGRSGRPDYAAGASSRWTSRSMSGQKYGTCSAGEPTTIEGIASPTAPPIRS